MRPIATNALSHKAFRRYDDIPSHSVRFGGGHKIGHSDLTARARRSPGRVLYSCAPKGRALVIVRFGITRTQRHPWYIPIPAKKFRVLCVCTVSILACARCNGPNFRESSAV